MTDQLAAWRTWKGRFWILLTLFIAFFLFTSFGPTRGLLIAPLRVHDADASGEIAYVMADGAATWERLLAASDLYHMHRVKEIFILNETNTSTYNFVRRKSNTRVQREVDYLEMLGVPADMIHAVPIVENDWLSSRSEAIGLLELRPETRSLVVVTSAPHTRRSRLCFERVFQGKASVSAYAASESSDGAELHLPIWIEYCKLAVYWICV